MCDWLHEQEDFKYGNFSIMGISQGSILTKYVLEYCPFELPIRSIVTFGGPHMGVSAVPHFPREEWIGWIFCLVIDRVIYLNIAQYLLAPADYFRVPNDPEGFLKHSKFLRDANNEANFNQTRKDLWIGLKFARFVKWEQDTTIIPDESSWWGKYDIDMNTLSRFDTDVYQKDLIGIRTLEEEGRADFVSIPGDHMDFSHEQINHIVSPVFRR